MVKSENFIIGEYDGDFYIQNRDAIMEIEDKTELIELISLIHEFLDSK